MYLLEQSHGCRRFADSALRVPRQEQTEEKSFSYWRFLLGVLFWPEGEEAQPIEADEHRAAFMTDDAKREWQ